MAESTDVNLPRHHKPLFPDRCVVCQAEEPDGTVRLITGTVGWWTWLLWMLGKPLIVKAPACRWCAWKLHGLRFVSLAATCFACWLVLWFFWPQVQHLVPEGLHRFAKIGLFILTVLPQCMFEVWYAPPFCVTAFKSSVDYEFTSHVYAVDFAVRNFDADAEWVKINDIELDADEFE